MTSVPSLPDPAATHPVARTARPGGRRASRSPRLAIGASVGLHVLLLALGTAAVRRAPRAGPPDAAGLVALDLPPTDDAPDVEAPEPLDDVEVVRPEPPALPPVAEADLAPPDAPPPPEDEPAPPPDEPLAEAAAPATPLPGPTDPTQRTRRDPPPPAPAPPVPAASTPVVAAAAPARGARPPLVALASPTPPLAPGGEPGATLIVVLEYTIGADGRVTDAVVRGSSGSEALDASTRDFVLAHWRYAPPGEPRRVSRRFVFTYGG